MSEAAATSEVGPPKDIKRYETEYSFEIKDSDELWDVAQKLTADPDFARCEVIIGRTDGTNVSSGPRLVADPEGFQFRLTCDIYDYVWGKMTSSQRAKTHLNRLIREYVNPEFRFGSWGGGQANTRWRSQIGV